MYAYSAFIYLLFDGSESFDLHLTLNERKKILRTVQKIKLEGDETYGYDFLNVYTIYSLPEDYSFKLEDKEYYPSEIFSRISAANRLYITSNGDVEIMIAAIGLLANICEKFRADLKATTPEDKADLFNIFNNYYIRHDNVKQKKFLTFLEAEYVFHTVLNTLKYLFKLKNQESK
jgi:hypothetical protein